MSKRSLIDFKTKQNAVRVLKNSNLPLNSKQIASAINLRGINSKKLLQRIITELLIEEIILEPEKYKYAYNFAQNTISGIININSNGSGHLECVAYKQDVFISSKNLSNCLNKDEVAVDIIKTRKKKIEGRVTNIISRNTMKFIGHISINNGIAFFIPQNKKTGSDFFISSDKLNKACNGDKVIVRFLEWPVSKNCPFGEVIKIIHKPESLQTEINSIIEIFNIRNEFSEKLKQELSLISEDVPTKEILLRRDFRNTNTFTIDPEDAKDFDDAISITKLDNNNLQLGVHIADVGHFVPIGSAIDMEARLRAFSIYFPGRVVPMLPEKLSNNLCSLKPNIDRLAFSITVDFTESLIPIFDSVWVGKSIIHSNKRLSYKLAQKTIDNDNMPYHFELKLLNNIAKDLRFKRVSSGSINFERNDVEFILDHNKEPTQVIQKKILDSHKLVEEFMLLANKLIANKLSDTKPFLYRVHDLPNTDKLNELNSYLATHKKRINTNLSPKLLAKEINRILQNTKEYKAIIELMILRSMSKAEYSINNIGHYGLGFKKYTHFTSPIRRYADLMVHRLVLKKLNNSIIVPQNMENMCTHFSNMERLYVDLERSTNKFVQLKLLKEKQDTVYDGTISGVVKWGIYVDLRGGQGEGLISVFDLKGDTYKYDDTLKQFVGKKTRKKYILGQIVQVEIKSVNLHTKELDLYLA